MAREISETERPQYFAVNNTFCKRSEVATHFLE